MISPPFPGGIFIEVEKIPIDLVIVRASDIPQRVTDPRCLYKAGITGSDIIWESGLGKNSGEEIPIYDLNPDAKRARLYVGVRKKFSQYIRKEKSREPTVRDLAETTIATKYVRIASEQLAQWQIAGIKIEPGSGTIEAMQFGYPDCNGILDVISSGRTAKANDIEILEIFYQVTLRMITAENKLTAKDITILDEIRELIAIAIQRKRML